MKLTAQSIRTITAPDGKADHIEWDDAMPGFGLRLRGEKRTYIIQYRTGQQQRRESLGDVRKVTLEAARNIARTKFAQVVLGLDPGAEKAKVRNTAAPLTLGKVTTRYLDAKRDILRPSTFGGANRDLNVRFAPLSERPIGAITRAEIAARLQDLIVENGRAAAARARSTLSSLYSWAMREGLCEANPVAMTNNPGQGEPRDRVLSNVELAAVWNACREDDFGRIVRLLILTGCRRDEISSLRWSEINGATITIPAARSKNRKAHSLALPQMAMDILGSIQRHPDRDFIFGQRGGGFSRWGWHTTALRNRLGQTVAPFTLHDLRRTAATGMAEIGIQPHIIEAVLNHVGHKTGVAGVYNRALYAQEKTIALARWAEHLLAIVGGERSKVVTMSKAIPTTFRR
jgi:integrase